MPNQFFEQPILNSPYAYPGRHWELDADGQPTNIIVESRRKSAFITPVPKPKKRRLGDAKKQVELVFQEGEGISTAEQQYDPNTIINEIRGYVDQWRQLRNPEQWQVTPETARLLQHWRSYPFQDIRPFFCQIEAVETAIWLTEVAPQQGERGRKFLDYLKSANEQANPEIFRIALKLATGAGKTTVIAMLVAWQTINAVRRPASKNFTRGFLIITPGITIRDRLRVVQHSDPDNYYEHREVVPGDLLGDIKRAKIVITNYHAFKLRERMEVSKVGRALLKGRGPELETTETEGQMLQRVMPDLMGMKSVLVINDEAHHCYRHKVTAAAETDEGLDTDEKEEAEKNSEAARLWIFGVEAVKRKLDVRTVFDLSATPFFLRGSGYAEGTLFPWTVCDFSLMDAIECGIVKLPRVPVSDNVPGADTPIYRELWEHIGKRMPKKGRGKSGTLDPLNLPVELQTALDALYGHYDKTYDLWAKAKIAVPPVFIIVCNNTSTSKLVYDYVSGFYRIGEDGKTPVHHAGRLALFRNYDESGNRLARPRSLLIDSEQLESGEALDKDFREMASDEIERFRREMIERGDVEKARKITDADLLREVMNTVGKEGRLGEPIRCVVSVSMLTEGWDANTVTHILGVRAFGTQLLCEQVVGRGLRRQSYDLDENGLLSVEYADILGIPFDFTAKPVVAPPKPPRPTVRVCAVRPERDALEIRFPRVEGYRIELPETGLTAKFSADSALRLTPDLVGPSIVRNEGIIGEGVTITVEHLKDIREATIIFHLTRHLLFTKYRDPGAEPKLHLFGQLKQIVRAWLKAGQLKCAGGTYAGQVLYREMADMACERIKAAITETLKGQNLIKAVLDAYNPEGSTAHVNFTTSRQTRWKTDARKCHVNWVVCDSDWEADFCRVAEAHPRVRAYVKNHGLGLEVPYLMGSTPRKYLPDFIVQIDDGHPDFLSLIVEIKGFRGEDAKEKANTMRTCWVPGVNNLEKFGRWEFAEFRSVFEVDRDFDNLVRSFVKQRK
ncbi:MAG TPA: DEAD/DEAH box helicase family protein [Candidatus Baltobacteraceae bacterium]|jgi:type III restriction enzyme|nr:DEAD/DEAH box helicase family protein [Candidatus Baltobacteraceae bacterium]